MAHLSGQPFRFLDLPKELRLIVYGFLPDQIIRTKYTRVIDGKPEDTFTLITTRAPKAILSTCKLIKEEADSIVGSVRQERVREITKERCDARLCGTAPRIESDCRSLCFLAEQGGIFDAVGKWYHLLRQECDDGNKSRLAAEGFLSAEFFSDSGYVTKDCTTKQGLQVAIDFIWKAGWALYHMSQTCSLSEFQTAGCQPDPWRFKLPGPLVQLALTLRDTDTPSDWYQEVTEFCALIESLESTFLVGFWMHLLNRGCIGEKARSFEDAIYFAISDCLYGGEMAEGVHGFVRGGVFELDTVQHAVYKRYWCGSGRS